MLFTKLPLPWSDLILTKWRAIDYPDRTDMLKARIEFAKMTLAYECKKEWKRKRVQRTKRSLDVRSKKYFPS